MTKVRFAEELSRLDNKKTTKTALAERLGLWRHRHQQNTPDPGSTSVIHVPVSTSKETTRSDFSGEDSSEASSGSDIEEIGRGSGARSDEEESGSTSDTEQSDIPAPHLARSKHNKAVVLVGRQVGSRPRPLDVGSTRGDEPNNLPIFYYNNEAQEVVVLNVFHISRVALLHGTALAFNFAAAAAAAYAGDGPGLWGAVVDGLRAYLPPHLANVAPNIQRLLGHLIASAASPPLVRIGPPSNSSSLATQRLRQGLQGQYRVCAPQAAVGTLRGHGAEGAADHEDECKQ